MAQYIYSINRLGKLVPPKKYILKNISLSFFPGAKIGVLGLNGSGKSTLLKLLLGQLVALVLERAMSRALQQPARSTTERTIS